MTVADPPVRTTLASAVAADASTTSVTLTDAAAINNNPAQSSVTFSVGTKIEIDFEMMLITQVLRFGLPHTQHVVWC